MKIVEKYLNLKYLHRRKQFLTLVSCYYDIQPWWQNMQLRFQISIDTAFLQVIWSVKFQRYQQAYGNGSLLLSLQMYWEVTEIYCIWCFTSVFHEMLQLTHIFWTFYTIALRVSSRFFVLGLDKAEYLFELSCRYLQFVFSWVPYTR